MFSYISENFVGTYRCNRLVRWKEEEDDEKNVPSNCDKIHCRTKLSKVERTFGQFEISTTVNEVQKDRKTI